MIETSVMEELSDHHQILLLINEKKIGKQKKLSRKELRANIFQETFY